MKKIRNLITIKTKELTSLNDDDYILGIYLGLVYRYGMIKGCNLDKDLVDDRFSIEFIDGFKSSIYTIKKEIDLANDFLSYYFDDNYLFSDACSLYYKGINIFPDVFGDEWRKYVPVESLQEIKRQVDKTLKNNK